MVCRMWLPRYTAQQNFREKSCISMNEKSETNLSFRVYCTGIIERTELFMEAETAITYAFRAYASRLKLGRTNGRVCHPHSKERLWGCSAVTFAVTWQWVSEAAVSLDAYTDVRAIAADQALSVGESVLFMIKAQPFHFVIIDLEMSCKKLRFVARILGWRRYLINWCNEITNSFSWKQCLNIY